MTEKQAKELRTIARMQKTFKDLYHNGECGLIDITPDGVHLAEKEFFELFSIFESKPFHTEQSKRDAQATVEFKGTKYFCIYNKEVRD